MYIYTASTFCNKSENSTAKKKSMNSFGIAFFLYGCKHIINVTSFFLLFTQNLHKENMVLFELCNLFSWNDKISVFWLIV